MLPLARHDLPERFVARDRLRLAAVEAADPRLGLLRPRRVDLPALRLVEAPQEFVRDAGALLGRQFQRAVDDLLGCVAHVATSATVYPRWVDRDGLSFPFVVATVTIPSSGRPHATMLVRAVRPVSVDAPRARRGRAG